MYICGQTGLEVQLGRAKESGKGSSRGCPNKLHSVESTVGDAQQTEEGPGSLNSQRCPKLGLLVPCKGG